MATIGTFTAKDGKIIGKIHTLTIDAGITFLPNTNDNPDAPAYRVFTGKMEVGAAWEKIAESTGRAYYAVKLDDPSFPAPIYANLVGTEDGTFSLIWSRPTRQS
jgi:uncharacterized protein (DUF736 family)